MPCLSQRDLFEAYRKRSSSFLKDVIGGAAKRALVRSLNREPMRLNVPCRDLAHKLCCKSEFESCQYQYHWQWQYSESLAVEKEDAEIRLNLPVKLANLAVALAVTGTVTVIIIMMAAPV